jgi:hypothetical protein
MFGSLYRWPEPKSRPIAGRAWNGMSVDARQEILLREGFSGDDAHRLCLKRWKRLSETERIWLATPLSLDEMGRLGSLERNLSKSVAAFRIRVLSGLFSRPR